MTTDAPARASNRMIPAILGYLAIWGAATGYLAFKGADWTFPIISLGIFGLAFSGLALLLTRGAKAADIAVTRPGVETGAILVFLAVYAVGFLGFGMGALREAFAPGQTQEIAVLVVKLLVHVAAPAIILVMLGARLAPLFASGPRPLTFWLTLLVIGGLITALMSVVSPSLQQIEALNVAWTVLAWTAPASFIWIALEAGLCEEFLFRAVLQTRLEAFMKSPVAAIVVASLLFGLAHAPGLFLRGGPDVDGWSTDPIQVIAFTLATLSPISLLFGVLWMRTRSLLLCVLLHATVDFLPNLSEFTAMWAPG